LSIMVILEYDLKLSERGPAKLFINGSPNVLLSLIKQSDPAKLLQKSCAMAAVHLANEFIKVVDNEAVLEQLATPYL
jgi:hypothetical protein